MRSILPQILLLLLLVPLFLAPVRGDGPTVTCAQALKALEGEDVFHRPKAVQVDRESPNPSSTLTYLCLNKGAALLQYDETIMYKLQDNNGVQYLLKLKWHRNISDSKMVRFRERAEAIYKMPEHSNLLNMKKFVQNEVDADGKPVKNEVSADGNPVKDDGTKNPKDTWNVYYALQEWGQPDTLLDLLESHPGYANNARWVGRTLLKIAQAVKHLHAYGNIHTKIDLDNVLFDANFEPKLFIPVKPASKDTPGSFQGHTPSAAPEVLALKLIDRNNDGFTWSEKQDTYSLGVLMFQMFDPTEFPFRCEDVPAPDTEDSARAQDPLEKRLYSKIMMGNFPVRLGLPFWAIRAMHGLLQFSKESRWGDDQILKALESFSAAPANPDIFQASATGSQLTVDTPINIPEGSSPEYITISTKWNLEELEALEAQYHTVLKSFKSADPLFLSESTPVHRFNLVR